MKHDQYNTKDIGEAAALITRGCRLADILWKDGIAFFLFDDPLAASIGHDYFYADLPLNARTYYDTLRMLKRKIYTGKGGDYVPRKR